MVDTHELEVWLSTSTALKDGVVDVERRKYLVAAVDSSRAYRIAVDLAWREDQPDRHRLAVRRYAEDEWQVTQVWWVP